MKIQIASDLHVEFYRKRMPPREKFQTVEERDLLVLAGDIGVQMMARKFIEQQLEVSPVIYIPGNHEYYSNKPRDEVDARWKTFGEDRPDFHYLIAETATLCNAVFFGAPLGTPISGDALRVQICR